MSPLRRTLLRFRCWVNGGHQFEFDTVPGAPSRVVDMSQRKGHHVAHMHAVVGGPGYEIAEVCKRCPYYKVVSHGIIEREGWRDDMRPQAWPGGVWPNS